MNFPKSKFAFTVKSTQARAPKTTEPEFTAIAGDKGRYKLNEAASKLMGLKPGDYLAFVNTEESVARLKEGYEQGDKEIVAEVEEMGGIDNVEVMWGIAKGWPLYDSAGNPQTVKKPLTNSEVAKLKEEGQVDENGKVIAPDVPAFKGSRLSTKMKEFKIGMILEGTDSNNIPQLRKEYNIDDHVVYSVSQEGIEAEFESGGGQTSAAVVYPITFTRTEEKIERNRS